MTDNTSRGLDVPNAGTVFLIFMVAAVLLFIGASAYEHLLQKTTNVTVDYVDDLREELRKDCLCTDRR